MPTPAAPTHLTVRIQPTPGQPLNQTFIISYLPLVLDASEYFKIWLAYPGQTEYLLYTTGTDHENNMVYASGGWGDLTDPSIPFSVRVEPYSVDPAFPPGPSISLGFGGTDYSLHPVPPIGVTKAIEPDGHRLIRWNEQSGVTGYKVYRGDRSDEISGRPWMGGSLLAVVPAIPANPQNSWIDPNTDISMNDSYYVSAYFANGLESDWTHAEPVDSPTLPGKPVLTISSVCTDAVHNIVTVEATWTGVTGDQPITYTLAYQQSLSTGLGPVIPVGTFAEGVNAFNVIGLFANVTYNFTLTATNIAGSTISDFVSLTPSCADGAGTGTTPPGVITPPSGPQWESCVEDTVVIGVGAWLVICDDPSLSFVE